VAAQQKLGLDSFLDRFEPQLGQPRNFRLCERLVDEIGVWIATPKRKPLRKPLRSLPGRSRASKSRPWATSCPNRVASSSPGSSASA
jgi:hypothetical protein